MGYIVTLGKLMAQKKAETTVKYYGGKLGNLLPTFSTHRPPYAGNYGSVTWSRGWRACSAPPRRRSSPSAVAAVILGGPARRGLRRWGVGGLLTSRRPRPL